MEVSSIMIQHQIPVSAVSCVIKKGGVIHMNIDIFQLLFNYLEERSYNNICQNVKQDADYIEAAMQESEMSEQ